MAPINYTDVEISECLLALIAWAGNASAAVRALEAEGRKTPTATTLLDWSRGKHAVKFQELNDKYAERIEGQLISRARALTGRAMEVQELALEKAADGLKSGRDKDPARTASHAAAVADKSNRSMLSLSGRPTSIREDRNATEIVRGLIAKGILSMPEEKPQLPKEAGSV